MADARDTRVWTRHAEEQWVTNRYAHKHNDDYVLRRWLLERLGQVKKVLDFGCGGGLWRDLFVEFEYTGYDQNDNMINHARCRFPETPDSFVCGPWNILPFGDHSFDLAFTSAVLQHNVHRDKAIVVAELHRVIRPGGFYMCTENTFREDNYHHTFPREPAWRPDLDDGYSFTPRGWEKFISSFGFSLVAFEPPGEYLYLRV